MVYPTRMPYPDDADATGPVFPLRDVVGADILAEVKQHAQRVWIRVFGLELVKREIPIAYAELATVRPALEASGDVTRTIYNRLLDAQRKAQKGQPRRVEPKKAPRRRFRLRDTRRPCVPAYYEGRQIGCYVHFSGDQCEIRDGGDACKRA